MRNKNKIRVTWYVDDGYVGKDRPQESIIDPEDVSGLEGLAREDAIAELVAVDFKKIIIKWHVNDGYMGGDRPQETEIDAEDLEGLSRCDRAREIEQMVKYDFDEVVTFEIDGEEVEQ